MKGISEIDVAYDKAIKELRQCYEKDGIVAGRHHYEDYWTRDAVFGCLASLSLNDDEIVKRHLNMLMKYQKSNGAIPFLVRRIFPFLNFLGIKPEIKPIACFRSHKTLFTSEVIDSNAYYVIACCEYIKQTNLEEEYVEFSVSMENALLWYISRLDSSKGLIAEGYIAGWNDGIYKHGVTLMTNVLLYKAISEYIALGSYFHDQINETIVKLGESIGIGIDKYLWNGSFFNDWIDKGEHKYFDSNANLLSVVWGIATKDQGLKILDYTAKKMVSFPYVKTVSPPYPLKRIEVVNKLMGMGDYWRGEKTCWPEPACFYSIACTMAGRKNESRRMTAAFAHEVIKNDGIFEIYKNTGEPLRQLCYSAEHPYARGAGCFILAVNALRGRK